VEFHIGEDEKSSYVQKVGSYWPSARAESSWHQARLNYEPQLTLLDLWLNPKVESTKLGPMIEQNGHEPKVDPNLSG